MNEVVVETIIFQLLAANTQKPDRRCVRKVLGGVSDRSYRALTYVVYSSRI